MGNVAASVQVLSGVYNAVRMKRQSRCRSVAVVIVLLMAGGCTDTPWNNPYPSGDSDKNIYYGSFRERPKHFDPASSYSENESVFHGQIYEAPLQYHFLKRPYELIANTATQVPVPRYLDGQGEALPSSAPAAAAAFSIYRIEIKPGILYQPHAAFAGAADGSYRYHALSADEVADKHALADFAESGTRELVAEDYVHQIKRLVHPRLHSPLAPFMAEYIVGLRELGETLTAHFGKETPNDESGYIDLREFSLAGVRATGRYSYEIKLYGAYPQFKFWLAMSFFSPIPWEADRFYSQPGMAENNITLDWYPIGTGPFMLVENNPNRRMVMVRNPNFRGETYPTEGEPGDAERGWLADAGKPMPFLDKAYFSLEKEAIPGWNKFLQGYYDASGIISDSFDQAIRFDSGGDAGLSESMKKQGIRLTTDVETSIFYMGFNMRDPVVGGYEEPARLLRRAIAIAVDYEEYISIFANGRGLASQGPIPPGIFGHIDGEAGINPYVFDWRDGKPKRKSIDAAQELMRRAGYPDGRDADTGTALVLNLDTAAGGPGSRAVLNWLRKQYAKLGIQLVIRGTDYNRFQEKMLNGRAQIFQWGWNADYPDPENFLFLLYGPNAKVRDNGENASNYEHPEFDALFENMKTLPDGDERQAVIDAMVETARRDGPWLWGFHPVAYSLHHAWYGNTKPNLMARNRLKYKRIDPQLRARRRTEWNRPVLLPVGLILFVLVVSIVPAVVSYRRRERGDAL